MEDLAIICLSVLGQETEPSNACSGLHESLWINKSIAATFTPLFWYTEISGAAVKIGLSHQSWKGGKIRSKQE